MRGHARTRLAAVSVVALVLATSGCVRARDTAKPGPSPSLTPTMASPGAPSSPATTTTISGAAGPGVDDKEIRLGVVAGLAGADGVSEAAVVEGIQAFWAVRNKDDGVCGRKVTLSVSDHRGDIQRAITGFRALEPEVLAFNHIGGLLPGLQLLPDIVDAKVPAIVNAPVARARADRNTIVAGATLDIDAANAIDWLARERGVDEGEVIGFIYTEGTLGEAGLPGARAAVLRRGLGILEKRVEQVDTDVSDVIEDLRAQNVTAIFAAVDGQKLVSVAATALTTTVVAPALAFDPSLLERSAARTALTGETFLVGPSTPFSGPAAGAARDAWTLADTGSPAHAGVALGYGYGRVMFEILRKTCDTLNRDGIRRALGAALGVATGGSLPELDLREAGRPSARSSVILEPVPEEKGGLAQRTDFFTSDAAAGL